MRFAKGHGTENDFVILLDPDGTTGLTAGLAARLCDRRAGIGGAVGGLGPGRAVVAGRTRQRLRMSVGNPHLACLVDEPLAGLDLSRAPDLDPAEFPEGANVELVRVTGPRSVAMRVYERGSGETRSCGTGAVAAAAAAAEAAGAGEGTWEVRVPGGDLTVTLEAGRAWLT